MLTKPDWIFDNCWCDRCHQQLGKLPKNNELVLVSDGLDHYYVYDNWDCAIQDCREGRMHEGCGQHDYSIMAKFELVIRKKPNWHISRTSIKILQLTVSKLYPEEAENARAMRATRKWK